MGMHGSPSCRDAARILESLRCLNLSRIFTNMVRISKLETKQKKERNISSATRECCNDVLLSRATESPPDINHSTTQHPGLSSNKNQSLDASDNSTTTTAPTRQTFGPKIFVACKRSIFMTVAWPVWKFSRITDQAYCKLATWLSSKRLCRVEFSSFLWWSHGR